jgi:hypothetical protein
VQRAQRALVAEYQRDEDAAPHREVTTRAL